MNRPLRFSDGPSAEVSRVVNAPASALWPYIVDIGLPARFSTEFRGAEWLHGATGASVGAEFRGTNENEMMGRWQVVCRVVELEPERVFAWEVQGREARVSLWRFTLDPVDGGTLVTQSCVLGPGRSGLTAAIERMPDREHDIIRGRLDDLAANMQRNLDGLAELTGGGRVGGD